MAWSMQEHRAEEKGRSVKQICKAGKIKKRRIDILNPIR